MLFMLKAHLEKPQSMSNKDFYGVWLKEAEAAVAAHKAGVISSTQDGTDGNDQQVDEFMLLSAGQSVGLPTLQSAP
jgi:hypothetical protein